MPGVKVEKYTANHLAAAGITQDGLPFVHIICCVMRKSAFRSFLLSYQKKDCPSFFGYDTDYKILLCCLQRLYSVVSVIPKNLKVHFLVTQLICAHFTSISLMLYVSFCLTMSVAHEILDFEITYNLILS